MALTRSRRKALTFCGCNTKSDRVVSLRVQVGDKRITYNCTCVQALELMLKYHFVWFDNLAHI